MSKTLPIGLLWVLFSISVSAQHKKLSTSEFLDNVPATRACHTELADIFLSKKHKKQNQYEFESAFKKHVLRYDKLRKLARQAEDTMIIPVIVHVIHDGDIVGSEENISTGQVNSQIDVLNEDYQRKPATLGYNTNPIGTGLPIKFVMALKDPSGAILPEPGIHRFNGGNATWNTVNDIETLLKPLTQFDPNKYLNIWVCKFGGSLASTLGYAQYPSLSNLGGLESDEGGLNTDGLVIRYYAFGRTGNVKSPYNKGRTTTHELGHFFGLRHIWGDESNCTGTDYCADTPPTTQQYTGCPSNQQSCTNGILSMVENYMDYTNDACMNTFTQDQKSRIMTVLQVCPRRKELLLSDVYIPSSLPSANFGLSPRHACIGATVTFTGAATLNPDFWRWSLYDHNNLEVFNSSSKNTNYTFTKAGSFSVKYIVGNAFGYDTLFKKDYISILSDTSLAFPNTQNFESNFKWQFYNPTGDSTWKINTAVSSGSGSKSIFYNNFDSLYYNVGSKTGIVTPRLNFQANSDSYLTFDLAYASYNNYNTDTMAIYYSTDCGKNFYNFWKKGGKNLATTGDKTDFFVPQTFEWRKEQISLAFLNGQPSVHLMFMNICGGGNNLYLDNINFLVPTRSSAPVSNFIVSPLTVCPGSLVTFSDQSTEYPTGWSWTISEVSGITNPISTNAQDPEIEFIVPGIYNVGLQASNLLGAGSNTIKPEHLLVAENPLISIKTSALSNTICGVVNLTATGALTYFWYDNRSVNSVNTGNIFTIQPSETTTYRVLGINGFGCVSNDTITFFVEQGCIPDAIETNYFDKSFKLYPNPSEKKITVSLENLINGSEASFSIIDLTGKILIKKVGLTDENIIDIQSLSPGIYFASLIIENKRIVRKLIKD